MAVRYTFTQDERLKREQHIETLFRTGKAFSVFPLRVLWLPLPRAETAAPVQAGFSAPKKKFRRANDRNRVKRLLREAWRLQKNELYETLSPDTGLHLFFIFTATELPEYNTVSEAVKKAIDKLQKAIAVAHHA